VFSPNLDAMQVGRRVMRGQKRVEDARKRAYDPRIHLFKECPHAASKLRMARTLCRLRGNENSATWMTAAAHRGLAPKRGKPMLTRRRLLAVSAAALVGATRADDWPQRPLRVIVPFGPGGGSDMVGRIIGQSLQDKLGQ